LACLSLSLFSSLHLSIRLIFSLVSTSRLPAFLSLSIYLSNSVHMPARLCLFLMLSDRLSLSLRLMMLSDRISLSPSHLSTCLSQRLICLLVSFSLGLLCPPCLCPFLRSSPRLFLSLRLISPPVSLSVSSPRLSLSLPQVISWPRQLHVHLWLARSLVSWHGRSWDAWWEHGGAGGGGSWRWWYQLPPPTPTTGQSVTESPRQRTSALLGEHLAPDIVKRMYCNFTVTVHTI
jgi:hypothetical protein